MIDNPPPPPKTLRKVGIINSDVKHKPAEKDATFSLHAAYLDWSVGEIFRRRKRECRTKSLKRQGIR